MKTRLKKGFTLIELLVVITIIAILASLAVPTFGRIQERGNITKGISNARQVITALRIYAADNNGNYPDNNLSGGGGVSSSNDAFRELFKEQILDAEQVFGCPVSSMGNPDGNTGSAPEYTQALEQNENHWAMTGGLSDSAPGSIPLVYENAVSYGTDPQWDPTKAGRNTKGRSWSGAKIIVGLNDSSVALQNLEDKTSTSGLKKEGSGGDNMFTRNEIDTILEPLGN